MEGRKQGPFLHIVKKAPVFYVKLNIELILEPYQSLHSLG